MRTHTIPLALFTALLIGGTGCRKSADDHGHDHERRKREQSAGAARQTAPPELVQAETRDERYQHQRGAVVIGKELALHGHAGDVQRDDAEQQEQAFAFAANR